MDKNLNNRISEFEKSTKNVVISYGGDGTLLETFHKNPEKAIIPIRNYGQCDRHKNLIHDVLNGTTKCKCDLKMRICETLECRGDRALSEIQIASANPTQCLRFNVYINNEPFMNNVIANGVIASTVIGSTGYFKSVARTIFRSGFGLGFICPTYGINNIILKETDWVTIEFVRDAEATISWDNITKTIEIEKGNIETIQMCSDNAALFGYDIFMCKDCRKGRNSTIINDQYWV
jgi:NAD kinase